MTTMSDCVEELIRRYGEDVQDHYPRSIGLFPIPEYPELESRGMWSSALDAILTTLRYLAPATLLTLFWGQQSFIFTILKHIDNAFRAIVFSSEEQKQSVLQWLSDRGPTKVEDLDTVWKHGWILCGVLDGVLPGACAGHPHTRLSLKHAQAIADHYLGVEPVFSRQELESHDSLNKHQQWKLATYLDRVRQALSKVNPPVSKPTSQRTSPETTQFTLDYVAKGSGLTIAQVNHRMSFKIFPTAQQAMDPGEVTILIRGPKDTYGMTVLPPILGKAQKIRQKLLGLDSKQIYTENALPLTHGATYFRAYGKNDMNKTYYIPKTVYDIDIEAEKRIDHVKVWYTVTLQGKYEISITSRGQCIAGSPFTVTASNNILGMLEKENYCLEDGEEIDIVDVKTDRKVVLRIVDFVTEKMLLKENGTLEKITEAEAKILMSTDIENERSCSVTEVRDHVQSPSNKFNKIAHNIMKMNRICKIFNDLMEEKRSMLAKKDTFICKRNNTDIPDIVNSTLNDANINSFILSEKRDKYIVPENISVSIRTEKSKPLYNDQIPKALELTNNFLEKPEDTSICTTPDSLERIPEEQIEDDNISVDRMTPMSSNNPFLTDACEDFAVEKKMGTYVKTEYERNNLQNEETRDSSIKIYVEPNDTPVLSPTKTNPFAEEDIRNLDRPKTPIYKIMAGDVSNRVDSPYLDPKNELIPEDMLGNEFVNPFFTHQYQSHQNFEQPPMTDFIIGAPVSLPPIIKAPSFNPESEMGSLITTVQMTDEENNDKSEEISKSVYSTPTHTQLEKPKDPSAVSLPFHSLDSSLTDTYDNSNASTTSDNQYEYRIDNQTNRDFSPRKDIWDSAYVSIDDNNGSPDNNNNENMIMTDTLTKQKISSKEENNTTKEDELSEMGPAERELWQTCAVLNETNKIQEDVRPYRWEIKRSIFTPIIEESDRSISSGMRDTSLKASEVDSVSVAFAELNDVYEEYFPNHENSSSFVTDESKLDSTVSIHTNETDDTGVESASETLSDVMRHEIEHEGTISEVQANVTESVSVSQPLRDTKNVHSEEYTGPKDETQFGDIKCSNIVLEKKRYWDEKIRQIEEKSEESAKLQRRFSAKQLKHDSLTKRKGKQIIKNFLNAGEQPTKYNSQTNIRPAIPFHNNTKEDENRPAVKLVDKWKKYWDDKLESNQEDIQSVSVESKQKKIIEPVQHTKEVQFEKVSDSTLPVRHEIPEEEVFKAFETSPRRFFGSSRKSILNKIDTFLGKPCSTVEKSLVEPSEVSPDSGLVSSRISLFHKITNTEPLPWATRKSQSLHNIHLRKDSETSITSVENSTSREIKSQCSNQKLEREHLSPASSVDSSDNATLKEKRARMTQKAFNQSFDEIDHKESNNDKELNKQTTSRVTKEMNKPGFTDKYKKQNILRRTSISKSEMDIFNKVPETEIVLDKHKSCDELPKTNVKSFISLYENVSKCAVATKPVKRINRPSSVDSQNHWQPISVNSGAEKKIDKPTPSRLENKRLSNTVTTMTSSTSKMSESVSIESIDLKTDSESIDLQQTSESEDKNTTYVSLSDIELEIVESSPDKSKESSPERLPHIEYKNRFNKAKQFFQSLEELREIKTPKKLNECEIMLNLNKQSESVESVNPQKRVKKKKTKSHSMPSSELAKYWNQMQENQTEDTTKLVKISEKFNVEDLFTDVTEGKLSRQGSLRGIPHKKAVLEAFRSMENITDDKLSPYEMTKSPISDFPNETKARNAQNYLSEYPYLPTTDPSNYHSRLDVKASGLITLKELLAKKVRRNSVPDLRLNPKFSAEL